MCRTAALFFLATVSLLFAEGDALANGRFPAANHLAIAPKDPKTMILRTTFGLLVSQDRGATWDWVCERAIGYGGQVEDPAVGITAKPAFLAGTFEGLAVSQDVGCGWGFVGGELKDKVVVDLIVRVDDPSTSLAMTNRFSGVDDAGAPLYESSLWTSADDGANWSKSGTPIDPTVIVETLEVAPSDPKRVYVSGERGSGASLQGVLLVSRDGGATWSEKTVPLDTANEHAPFIAAVDPKNADRVYIRTSGATSSRLLVTDDGGASFAPKFMTTGPMLGFALSPDGGKAYLGGPRDGLWVASTSDFAFAKKSEVEVQCLRAHETSLWVCSNEVSGFILGESTDDGANIDARLHLATIRGPLACAAGTSTAACADDWQKLRDGFGLPAVDAGADAGPVDAGADAGPAPPPPPAPSSKSCGCWTIPHEGAGAAAIFALGGAGVLAVRRRTRKGGE